MKLTNIFLIYRCCGTFVANAIVFNTSRLFGNIYLNLAATAVVSLVAAVVSMQLIRRFGRIPSSFCCSLCIVALGVTSTVLIYIDGKLLYIS